MGTNSYHGAAVERAVQTRSNNAQANAQGQRSGNVHDIRSVSGSSWYHEAAIRDVKPTPRPHAS